MVCLSYNNTADRVCVSYNNGCAICQHFNFWAPFPSSGDSQTKFQSNQNAEKLAANNILTIPKWDRTTQHYGCCVGTQGCRVAGCRTAVCRVVGCGDCRVCRICSNRENTRNVRSTVHGALNTEASTGFIWNDKYIGENTCAVTECRKYIGHKMPNAQRDEVVEMQQHTAIRCGHLTNHFNTLQHTATHCNNTVKQLRKTPQDTAANWSAIQCSTLQHVAVPFLQPRSHTTAQQAVTVAVCPIATYLKHFATLYNARHICVVLQCSAI